MFEEEREPVLFAVSGQVLNAARKQILRCDHCSEGADIRSSGLSVK
jgi:hypothetical protein